MDQNATGWCAALIARRGNSANSHSGNMSYDLNGPDSGGAGTIRGSCGRININVSHTHSFSEVEIYLIKIYILMILFFLLDSL